MSQQGDNRGNTGEISRHRSLTRLNHRHLGEHLRPGDLAIDATAGNGHDTLFLAQQVAPGGRVLGFDIQPQALHNTRERLLQAGIDAHSIELCLDSHRHMLEQAPPDWRGRVAAITFNLGYLPGGDKHLVTQAGDTLEALRQSLLMLRPAGLLSVMVYPGHPGGQEEATQVADWLATQVQLRVQQFDSPGPKLYLATLQND